MPQELVFVVEFINFLRIALFKLAMKENRNVLVGRNGFSNDRPRICLAYSSLFVICGLGDGGKRELSYDESEINRLIERILRYLFWEVKILEY